MKKSDIEILINLESLSDDDLVATATQYPYYKKLQELAASNSEADLKVGRQLHERLLKLLEANKDVDSHYYNAIQQLIKVTETINNDKSIK